jgi:hypothetical protein
MTVPAMAAARMAYATVALPGTVRRGEPVP